MLEFIIGFTVEAATEVIDTVLDPVGRLVSGWKKRQRAGWEKKIGKESEQNQRQRA